MLLDETKKIIEALLFMKGEDGLNIEYFSIKLLKNKGIEIGN